MKTELRKVYICEHCDKKMFGAGAMARHEKYCTRNPHNKHKCFDFCKHLLKTSEVVYNGGEPYCRRTVFTCGKTNKEMYSFILEKHASLWPYDKILDGKERMPLECDLFEPMSFEQQCERFGI